MELLRCRYCGAPYAYRENLELHEKSCPKRPAAPAKPTRYVMPVEIQRAWIGYRKKLLTEGRGLCEWSAGLHLFEREFIHHIDYREGCAGWAPPVSLEMVTNPIGGVHFHAHPSQPPFNSVADRSFFIYSSLRWVPENLNPFFVVAFSDDSALWWMLPKPEVVRSYWEKERFKTREVHEKKVPIMVPGLVEDPAECAQANTYHELFNLGLVRWGHFALGERNQLFPLF